eukprot:gene15328-10962_t
MEPAQDPQEAAEGPKASSLNDRLFAIRMKINQSRKQNRDDVTEEFERVSRKRSSEGDGDEAPDRPGHKRNKGARTKPGSSEALLNTTAQEALRAAEKRQQKEEVAASYGLSAFTSDASYRAYEKRVEKISASAPASSASQEVSLAENPLDYGSVNSSVSPEALERLRSDVLERENARKKFSKRRLGENSGDVDFINEKNRQFNKKLRGAFDKYTVEIRQNLERGTAL